MQLHLVEAIDVKPATRHYSIFLCADNTHGKKFGIEVLGFQPRILVECSHDVVLNIVERARSWAAWKFDQDSPQLVYRSIQTRHLCGYQRGRVNIFEIKSDSPSVHAEIFRICRMRQLKVHRELSIEKQLLQAIGIEFGGWFTVQPLRINENPKRMQRHYNTIVPASSETELNPIVLYYDIEANRKVTQRFPNASEGDEIECIGMETSNGQRLLLTRFQVYRRMRKPYHNTEVRLFESEKLLLLAFAKILSEELQPTYLCAHNGYGFDIIFIFQAAVRLGITAFEQHLCAFPFVKTFAKYRERIRRTNQLGARNVGEMAVPGLVHLDTMLYSLTTFKLSSYSLNSVSSFLKIDMQKDEMSPAELFRAFDCTPRTSDLISLEIVLSQIKFFCKSTFPKNVFVLIVEYIGISVSKLWQETELGRLAEYCMVDVALLAKMAKRMKLVISMINFGRVTCTSPQEYANIGEQAKSFSLISHHCQLHNIIIDKERLPTPAPYPGATVLDATPGLYTTPVICCDFMSLYPSIIQAWNLSYDTILCYRDQMLTPGDVGLTDAQCHKFTVSDGREVYVVKKEVTHGVLPQIVKSLLQRRKEAKKLMKSATNETDVMLADCLQKALKVTANALYGFTGVVEHALLSNTLIAQIITLMGRYLIQQTSAIAQEQFPVKVIYGDTDSVFLLPNDLNCSMSDAWSIGEAIAHKCTNAFPEPVILEMEKICYPFAQEAKKRYISMVYESPHDHGHFDAKGVDIARRDNAVWHREFYAEAMHHICPLPPFTRQSIVENVMRVILNNLADIVEDNVPVDKFVITKSIKDEQDYIAGQRGEQVNLPQIQAANRFKQQITNGFPAEPPRAGDRVPYVICAGYAKETHKRAQHIEWVKANNIPPCRLYYLKHVSASLQRFIDATLQDTRISACFEKAINKVAQSMQQINARRAGNMSLTSFFINSSNPATTTTLTISSSQVKKNKKKTKQLTLNLI